MESYIVLCSFTYIKLCLAEIWPLTKISYYITLWIKADMNEVKLQVSRCTNSLKMFQRYFKLSFNSLWDTQAVIYSYCAIQLKLKTEERCRLWKTAIYPSAFIALQTIRKQVKVEKKYFSTSIQLVSYALNVNKMLFIKWQLGEHRVKKKK